MKTATVVVAACVLLLTGCAGSHPPASSNPTNAGAPYELTSDSGEPRQYWHGSTLRLRITRGDNWAGSSKLLALGFDAEPFDTAHAVVCTSGDDVVFREGQTGKKRDLDDVEPHSGAANALAELQPAVFVDWRGTVLAAGRFSAAPDSGMLRLIDWRTHRELQVDSRKIESVAFLDAAGWRYMSGDAYAKGQFPQPRESRGTSSKDSPAGMTQMRVAVGVLGAGAMAAGLLAAISVHTSISDLEDANLPVPDRLKWEEKGWMALSSSGLVAIVLALAADGTDQ